jgi:hypothetical protein
VGHPELPKPEPAEFTSVVDLTRSESLSDLLRGSALRGNLCVGAGRPAEVRVSEVIATIDLRDVVSR